MIQFKQVSWLKPGNDETNNKGLDIQEVKNHFILHYLSFITL